MKRKFTGRTLTTIEFKKLNQCMECRHMEDIPKNSICESCKKLNRGRCKQCTCVLRNEKEKSNKYYIYNDAENDKEKINKHYLSKRLIKEYLVEDIIRYKKYSDDLCQDCHEHIEYIKENFESLNECVVCKNKLLVNPTPDGMVEHFKNNGKWCEYCNNRQYE